MTVSSPEADDARRLAAKALLLGARCSQTRIMALLRVSRWTVGRIAQRKTVADSPDPKVRELAQACLEESITRGSTPEERAAALAWLRTPTIPTTTTGAPPDANVGRDVQIANAIVDPPGAAVATPEPDSGRRPRVASSRPPAKMKSAGRSVQDHESLRSCTPLSGTATNGAHAGLAREQLEAVSQQQRRILHRTVILDCALKADALDPPTMREAVADLLGDITEAARAIGTIMQRAAR